MNQPDGKISNITRANWKSLIKEKFMERIEDSIKNTNVVKLGFIKKSKFFSKEAILSRKGEFHC